MFPPNTYSVPSLGIPTRAWLVRPGGDPLAESCCHESAKTVVDTVVETVCVAVIEVPVKLEELLVLMEEEEVDEDAVVDTVVVHVPVVVGRDEDMVSSYTSLRRARSLGIPPTMYIRLSPDTQKPGKKARLLGSEPPGLTSCHRLA